MRRLQSWTWHRSSAADRLPDPTGAVQVPLQVASRPPDVDGLILDSSVANRVPIVLHDDGRRRRVRHVDSDEVMARTHVAISTGPPSGMAVNSPKCPDHPVADEPGCGRAT